MKKCIKIYCLSIFLVLVTMNVVQAEEFDDVIYLKNGSIIRGHITEQLPQEGTYKIQTLGGSIFVFNSDEIENVAREPKLQTARIQSADYPIVNTPPSRNHAIGLSTWVLTITNLDAPENVDNDTQFEGGSLTYQFAVNNHLAMRFNLYSAEHEDLKDLNINGLNGLILLTSNARNNGFKVFMGAGYFNEKWENNSDSETFNGGELLFGGGYNWSRVGLDVNIGVRSQSSYDIPDEVDLLYLTGGLRLTFRF